MTELDEINKAIGGRLSQARLNAGISQRDVCAALGISRSTLQNWERGDKSPPSRQLLELAKLYGVCTDWLLGLHPHPKLLPPGWVLSDEDKVNRVLGSTDPDKLEPEFAATPPPIVDWNTVIPDNCVLRPPDKGMELARRIDDHLHRHAKQRIGRWVKRHWGSAWEYDPEAKQ